MCSLFDIHHKKTTLANAGAVNLYVILFAGKASLKKYNLYNIFTTGSRSSSPSHAERFFGRCLGLQKAA